MDSEPLSQTRLRHQLDVQLRQINRVLRQHHVPATVDGGSVLPRAISFDIQTQLAAGLEKVRGLKDDLMAALGVSDVALVNEEGHWRLRVSRPDEAPVPLLKLLASLPDLSPTTAPIGLANGEQPVLLRFAANHVKHVLIAGELGAGKTNLLRTIGAGLAFTNRQSDLQLLVMDPRGLEADHSQTAHPLRPLGYLPHMLTDPAGTQADCETIIHFLAEEMEYRRKERVRCPRIVVLMDHVVSFLEAGGQNASHDLLRLLQNGAGAGIHLVLSTDQPDAPQLANRTWRAAISVQVIGRLGAGAKLPAWVSAKAEQLPPLYGGGDFLAVAGEDVSYLQAAYIGDYDLHMKLNEMYNVARPRLLARPFSTRPRLAGDETPAPEQQSFSARGGAVWLSDEDEDAPGGAPIVDEDEV